MFSNDKVVWSEGMFLQPQHFQQHQRYQRGQLTQGLQAIHPGTWGFTALKIDPAQLAMGRICLLECAGILPDGTLFDLDTQSLALASFVVPEGARDLEVVLALPMTSASTTEVVREPGPDSLARYRLVEVQVSDSNADGAEQATLQLAQLNLRLARQQDVARSHEYLGTVRVLERSPSGQVCLDEAFIAPVLSWRLAPQLAAFVDDFLGRVKQRGYMLSNNMGVPGLGGVAEVQHFLMLQTINRAEVILAHLAVYPGLHPETLYRELLSLAGELSIFFEANKRPKSYPAYRHDRLAETFEPVLKDLVYTLSAQAGTDVVPLTLTDRDHGIRFAAALDGGLYASARFVLAVRAQVPDEELRKTFPVCLKIGPIERVADLVELQLPGLDVCVLPAAPRELPYYAGFSYFELQSDSPLWQELKTSAGFGLHVAGDFPGLQLAFWAIKEPQ
ncbi:MULTISPECIES: type VI secretion system baseplate subunit TssK [unclassified Pseudomonas]|uniref:type VI secretion system baseplate subunit TssK n=1 Tax=unclassified Pseudomonas TaxID=196821 RepID=UPI0011991246|nr:MULTISPECIES: type VI secretion system baseplate subunit TssK [unclassified Pseudomonas]TWC06645.1 type VI secretion system protein ImpJ [Pseudomonas sp. SJZ075]TWC26627.1 type VI secretion system protein ImpJ [Pseudomonas sp. SJZ078]TWC45366.1 type VI secretion system protein ImpJ [Pseudomonas sp. SJZ124]TWC46142.1 type VI secretion system protein ImpJ [Pseudomonas sp. SJZ080]TWC80447.1 type VI secretion system protein ImpJ [Pseudomonas sp. SJZ101]